MKYFFSCFFLIILSYSNGQVSSHFVWEEMHNSVKDIPLIDMEYSTDGKHIIAAFSDSIRIFNIKEGAVTNSFHFTCNTDVIYYKQGRKLFYKHEGNPYITFFKRDTSYFIGSNDKYSVKYESIYSVITKNYLTGEDIQKKVLDTTRFITYENSLPSDSKEEYLLKTSNTGVAIYKDDHFYLFKEKLQDVQVLSFKDEVKDFALMDNGHLWVYLEGQLKLVEGNNSGKFFPQEEIDNIFSLNGNSYATCNKGVVKFYNFIDKPVFQSELDLHDNITHMTQNLNGEVLYSYHNVGFNRGNRNVFLIDSTYNKYGELLIEGGQSLIVRQHPFDNSLLITTKDNSLSVFDLDAQIDNPVFAYQTSHEGRSIEYLTFSEDGKYMATLCDQNIVIWDVKLKKVIERYEVELIDGIQFTTDGTYDIICSDGVKLKWKNWLSNYTSLKLQNSGVSGNYIEKNVDRSLKDWEKGRKGFERPDYFDDQGLSKRGKFFCGIFKNLETYNKCVVVGTNKSNGELLSVFPGKETPQILEFVNDSVVAISSSNTIHLVNLETKRNIGKFIIHEPSELKGVGMYGVLELGEIEDQLYSFCDEHQVTFYDKESGLQTKQYSTGYKELGSKKWFDISSDYVTYLMNNQNTRFQFSGKNDGTYNYAIMCNKLDSVVEIKNLTIQFIDAPESIISAVKIVGNRSKIALVRSNCVKENNGVKEELNCKTFLRVQDMELKKMDFEIELPSELKYPSMTLSENGKFAAFWNVGECSNSYRNKWNKGWGNEDSDSFDKIIIVDLSTQKINKLSLTNLGINRIHLDDVKFVPNNPNILIIRDDFKSTVRYVQIDKKRTIATLYGIPLKTKKTDRDAGSIESPFFPSYSGDTLFYSMGNPIFNSIHNHIRGYSISRDEIVLEYSDPIRIKSATELYGEQKLLLGHLDNSLTIIDLSKKERVGKFISSKGGSVFLSPENYYRGDQEATKDVFFKVNTELYAFDQFDLKYNRPDIVLERLGYASVEKIESFRRAYEKRLQKMGFTEEMLKADFHLPEVSITNEDDLPVQFEDEKLSIKINATDSKYPLDRINVWINNVPIYGINGISLRDKNTQDFETAIELQLNEGDNKIEVSVLNQAGAESYKETVYIKCTKPAPKPNLYFVGIGVKDYVDESMNLKYSDKDIRDVANLYSTSSLYGKIYIDTFLNATVTKDIIPHIRKRLESSTIHDQVIFMYSGHGVLDDSLDYYLTTHDIDFLKPSAKGIPYEAVDELLDNIPARQKLVLIDACNSGEVDKDELEVDNTTGITAEVIAPKGDMFKKYATKTNSFEMMQELFTDLRRGTGATVISSSSGKYFSFEDKKYQNGVYTYALKLGLEGAADANEDNEITVSELKEFLYKKVESLTNGKQKPTARQENLEYDFRVW